MYYNEIDTQKILEATNNRIIDVIGDFTSLRKKNNEYSGECPLCHGEHSFKINEAKGVYKCFKCNGISGNKASHYLIEAQNMTFPESLDYLNHKFSIIADIPEQPVKKLSKKISKSTKSYCDRMLAESGLTYDDVKSTCLSIISENHTITESTVFKKGTLDKYYKPDYTVDDVIIEYYDLEGAPCLYETLNDKGKPSGKFDFFNRVRFQFPDEHKDKNGKPCKYKSPYGSGNFIYIPNKLRQHIKSGGKIDHLFIQEGEKKAEKACKHGIWSVGIAGIQNLAHNGKLPIDLITIIQKAEIKKTTLLFDADWNDLSNAIKINDSVDMRPRNFYYAAKNFKEYIRTLENREIFVEIYIGHVQPNEAGNKGIDDLLAGILKDNPEVLLTDLNHLINEKDLTGKYLQLFKITAINDTKIQEIWKLNNPTAFAKSHADILRPLPKFRIGQHIWRFNDEGTDIESAQPLESDEKYWQEVRGKDRNGGDKPVTYEFKYGRCFTFLQNRGFYRMKELDGKSFSFIHIDHPLVRVVQPYEIRDYVTDFTKVAANEDVLEMIYKGGVQYLGPDKLSNLNFTQPNFEEPERDFQRMYFQNTVWEIKATEITEIDYSAVNYNIWHDQRHNDPAILSKKPLIEVSLNDDKVFSYKLSEDGKRCQFLQFLINASNYTWRKEKQINEGDKTVSIDTDELNENVLHLISKLAAFGYLALSAKDRNISRAVVAMDGKQSEVGQSNGRSGKSILGEALKQVVKTLYIDGKKKDIEGDIFIWDGLDEKFKGVFMDDVRTNFSLEFLFANITGDWNANWKGGKRFTIPFNQSPKIYITTNHALNGRDASFFDRQYIIAFSDFYNAEHKPKDDFGGLFFDDWDFDQWNLFWNLLANCLQIYLKFGCIQAPRERIETRQLRQDMGETFLSWADEYFSDPDKLNCRLIRKTLYDEYLKWSNINPKFISPTAFKNKVKAFCIWKGYDFNPHLLDPTSGKPLKYDKDGKPDMDDKSGGIEYFYIGDRPVNAIDAAITTEDNQFLPHNDDKPF